MIEIYREIVRLQEKGQRSVLATVVATQGSTPRKAGAQMLLREDGSFLGSVSGGIVEADVQQIAREVLQSGEPRLYERRLDELEADRLGLTCGGTIRVFIERI